MAVCEYKQQRLSCRTVGKNSSTFIGGGRVGSETRRSLACVKI